MSPHTIKSWLCRISKEAKCNSNGNDKQALGKLQEEYIKVRAEHYVRVQSLPYTAKQWLPPLRFWKPTVPIS